MNKFKDFIEWHVFGVCSAIGERMGIATSTIRKNFIYISFNGVACCGLFVRCFLDEYKKVYTER